MKYYSDSLNAVYKGNCLTVLRELPDESVDMCMTSPPYWGLRTYKTEPIDWGNWKGELGLEPTIELYIEHLMLIFNEIKRVLKKTGTIFVNIADSYANSGQGWGDTKTTNKNHTGSRQREKPLKVNLPAKSLCLIPFRFAIQMVEQKWILRNTIIWHKPNPMPESVKDRFTEDFEYVFMFAQSQKYYFEQQFEQSIDPESINGRRPRSYSRQDYSHMAINKPTNMDINNDAGKIYLNRNKRCVWSINTQPYPETHFATYPEKLCETPLLAGCPKGGTVLDPFAGSGTTLAVAKRLNRKGIGIELSTDYCKLAVKRISEISIPMELGI